MPEADVALLTDRRYTASTADPGDWYLGNILADDGLLQAALLRRGLTSVRVDWADPSVDWSAFRCAVFRTTWDYFERFAEFTAWLDRIERQTRVCNSIPTIRWNMDKQYLLHLDARGIPIVASWFLGGQSNLTLTETLDLVFTQWPEAVIKPCVSGAARHTYRVNRDTIGGLMPLLESLLATENLILQPFMTDITSTGEDTLMVFGGRYSHAVRKVAKAGDFRVQDDFGGKVYEYHPTAEQIELAERAVRAVTYHHHPMPVYGRVDMVRDNDGQLAIMEMELIEPELWLRFHPPAADTFADAVVAFLTTDV